MATANPTLKAPGPAAPAPAVIDFETTKEVGYYQLVWRRFIARKVAILAMGMLLLLVLSCLVIPIFLGSPDQPDPSHSYLSPLAPGHPMGTDEIGRDLLTRNLVGGRVSLLVGFLAMTLTLLVATVLGALSGFFGGVLDAVVSAITNAFLAVPSLLILIVLATVWKGSLIAVVIAISLVSWPSTARIVRAVVLSLREKEFVEAAAALGTPRWRVVTRHILPNALGTIVVSASLTIGSAILAESAASFLGVGVGAPFATWGSILDGGYIAISGHSDFFYAFFPGMFILITVLSFNYLGDALRDAFDPRALER